MTHCNLIFNGFYYAMFILECTYSNAWIRPSAIFRFQQDPNWKDTTNAGDVFCCTENTSSILLISIIIRKVCLGYSVQRHQEPFMTVNLFRETNAPIPREYSIIYVSLMIPYGINRVSAPYVIVSLTDIDSLTYIWRTQTITLSKWK